MLTQGGALPCKAPTLPNSWRQKTDVACHSATLQCFMHMCGAASYRVLQQDFNILSPPNQERMVRGTGNHIRWPKVLPHSAVFWDQERRLQEKLRMVARTFSDPPQNETIEDSSSHRRKKRFIMTRSSCGPSVPEGFNIIRKIIWLAESWDKSSQFWKKKYSAYRL